MKIDTLFHIIYSPFLDGCSAENKGLLERAVMEIRVSCYAGYRGEETPVRFWIGDRAVEVTAVEDRWLAPEHRYFKVRGDDGARYILRHDNQAWRWELVFFQRI